MNAQIEYILGEKRKDLWKFNRTQNHSSLRGFLRRHILYLVYDNGISENKKYDVTFEVLFHHRQIFENQPWNYKINKHA